ncbi:MAG: FkbM family methyltransferase [Bacteroidia bacterium]|nr:FkbM family methyltransferase [Bacteroidia bacterium]MDW8346582.1 FkbM family methyltransferase [Bacteroidia bacterium]
MSLVRKVLFRTLGPKNYLKLISKIYLKRIEKGQYKDKYPELHFLQYFIKPDFYCIDIGANLGYYSYFLCKHAYQGKVWAVEPVPLFAEVLRSNCPFSNFTHVPYALGAQNTSILMETPVVNGVFRHGLTKVVSHNQLPSRYSYQVEMKIPNELFQGLPRLDFVKCDVEGYEGIIFENFMSIIKKHLPILQVEIQSSSKDILYRLLSEVGYLPYQLHNQKWLLLDYQDYLLCDKDIYFICRKKGH